MLRIQRPHNRSPKAKERIDFKFSNFQALEVPKGWDRLFVSITSVETGKTLAKSGKTLVRNGSCQWTETLSESIYVTSDTSSKGNEEYQVRLAVSMGSTRSSTLGELTINMAQYASSRVSTVAISQPLKKCSYGTILQAKVQCLSRRSRIGDKESYHSSSQESNLNIDQPDPNKKSFSGSNGSLMKFDSQELTQSASGSVQSFDSVNAAESKNLSVKNVYNEDKYDSHGTQSRGSYGSSPMRSDYSAGDDSPPKQPSLNSRLYSGENFRNEASASRSSITNLGSSTSLLEVAEDTIDELRAEAKMWERNARKLMIDLDMSKREFSDLSKKQAELVMQLSAAHTEHEGLRKEVEKLKEELQRSKTNQATREDTFLQLENLIRIQKELENEIRHQQELNDDLGHQLKQSQESNIALVSVVQELEETVEQQKNEIENPSSQTVNLTSFEDSIDKKSEDGGPLLLQLQQLQEAEKKLQAEVQLLEKALRDKTDELTNKQNTNREILVSVERDHRNVSVKEEEIDCLQSKKLKELDEKNAELVREIESLRERVHELETDCTELTDENLELLYKLKDLNKTDIRKCVSVDSISSEHPNISPSDGSEVSDPKYQNSHVDEELDNKESQEATHLRFNSLECLNEILKQIDVAFHSLMKPWHHFSYYESETYSDLMNASQENTTTRMSPEYILSSLQELNKLLGMRITKSEEILMNQGNELKEKNDIIADAETEIKDAALQIQEFEKVMAESEENKANLMKELKQKRSEFAEMEANLVSKEKEVDILLQTTSELEAEISGLRQKTSHLEQDMEMVIRERNTFSESEENLQNEVIALHRTINSHISANNDLVSNLEKIERKGHEFEHSISQLQEKNMTLQDTIVGLEAQVRQLEDEREICLHEADNSKIVAESLHEEIKKLKAEMDTLIIDHKQKTEDMEKKWLEAQDECEYLKGENKTLQASVATFVQENMKLQDVNFELKTANQELESNCSHLAAQLSESKISLSDCTMKIESLEKHLVSVLDDFTLRENSYKSEIDVLVKENSSQKEKLAQEGSLRQMFLEQSTEFESLQKEVEHLTKQVADVRCEKEQISYEASGEVSQLLADKAELQASLQEIQLRAELVENKLNTALQESKLQVKDLTGQLTASQEGHERLMADHDRILKLLASYKKSEAKLKTGVNDLELKLTISDYERQQLTKEMSTLKAQLQSMSDLQNEVLNLKSELKDCRLDKGNLELTLKTVSREYEEMKAEKFSLSEKVTIFQEAMYEFEECKRNRLALEEKLRNMENELNAKEILCIQNGDLKNEIIEMKKANAQFQQKMYILEEERDECLKKAQNLEEDLKSLKERDCIYKEGANYHGFHDGNYHGDHEISEGLEENNRNRVHTDSHYENYAAASKKSTMSGEIVAKEGYERTKSSLQAELKELRERYLEMSLKYAEVEAQRENLVMKLKAIRPERRWFS